MKKRMLLFLQFLLIAGVFAQKNDLSGAKLNGKIKSLTTKVIFSDPPKTGSTMRGPWYTFSTTTVIYNAKGFQTERKELNKENVLTSRSVFIYDGKGNNAETDYYNAAGTTGKSIYKFDAKGNRTEQQDYKADGSVSYKYVFVFDEMGNEIESSGYNVDGSLNAKYVSRYDPYGNRIDYKWLNANGSVNATYISSYDGSGNLIEEKSTIYIMSKRTTHEYDQHRNKISETAYKTDGSVKYKNLWQYEYDKNGNWIRLTETDEQGAPFYKEERTIVYY